MRNNSGPGVLPALVSLGSLIAALSCCLPLGTMLLAAGSATASVLSEELRPWLLAFSLASVIFAFAQTYYLKRCDFRQRRARTVLLWFTNGCVLNACLPALHLDSDSGASAIVPGEQPVTGFR